MALKSKYFKSICQIIIEIAYMVVIKQINAFYKSVTITTSLIK